MADLFNAAKIDPSQVLLLRHTYTKTGLTGPEDRTPARVVAYARERAISGNKFPKTPPTVWLNLIAVGGNRCRFIGAYENQGEAVAERTET